MSAGAATPGALGSLRRLENPIRSYTWGSHTFLAEIQGRPVPTSEPEAELWMGAHPSCPSRVVDGEARVPLDAWIARDPAGILGASVAERFDDELPFLVKILAVEEALSLQVHPDADQAREGFAREEAAGVPVDAPERCYRDRRPKPELVCALTPFDALVGLRPVGEARETLARLAVPAVAPLVEALDAHTDAEGLRAAWALVPALRGPCEEPVNAIAEAARRAAATDATAALVGELAEVWPGDPAILAPCFLNRLTLEPGEALSVGAGTLHGYLRGAALEVQANSDNVLRAGLTNKHIDPDELLRIARFEPERPRPAVLSDVAWGPFFRVDAVDVRSGTPLPGKGVRIVVCVEGRVELAGVVGEPIVLGPGEACFVPAAAGACRARGEGRLFQARAGEPG